jgi:3-hydroxyacyl-CoA dehydrogenase/enoyl-CoA hydratase/3-hydroxybutyryl-CoA epimerase/enoyl-CoA isomerase
VNVERTKLSLHETESQPSGHAPDVGVYLIGAGVVGSAILQAHLDAGISVWLADQDETAVVSAIQGVRFSGDEWDVSRVQKISDSLFAVEFRNCESQAPYPQTLVIESIVEKMDVKQAFFTEVEQVFGDEAILCTNTSTLSVSRIAESLEHPERFSGMHFFMPVWDRVAVELIAGGKTQPSATQACITHVQRLGKEPLLVGDGHGFVVNRLLSPYLNEAMLLLCRGVSAERIEDAALAYGMPMSPLELIDWIGTPTMFDAGRAFWQAFPGRIDPAPMLVALIKSKRFGRAVSRGLYDYCDGRRSEHLSPHAVEFSEKYCRQTVDFDSSQLTGILTVPMWIEAAFALREGVVNSHEQFDLAMRGGLGFDSGRPWNAFFDSMGSEAILSAIEDWSGLTKAIDAPEEMRQLLVSHAPTDALVAYGGNSA